MISLMLRLPCTADTYSVAPSYIIISEVFQQVKNM